MPGKAVGVYQDAFLELTESPGGSPAGREGGGTGKDGSAGGEKEVAANRPFLFVLAVGRDVVAFGRIKDPYWCKFCENKNGGGNFSAVPEVKRGKKKMEKEESKGKSSSSWWANIKNFFRGRKADKQ